jgi:hypothetical protein
MERPLDLALSREPSKFSINEVKRRMKKPEKEKKRSYKSKRKVTNPTPAISSGSGGWWAGRRRRPRVAVEVALGFGV